MPKSVAQIAPDKISKANVQELLNELPVILFSTDSSQLTATARNQIREIALLINHPELIEHPVIIEGHSDTLGNAHGNMILSTQRAEAVTRELVINGVRSSRLTTSGRGERQPLITEIAPDGQRDQTAASMNRRVEILLITLEAIETQP